MKLKKIIAIITLGSLFALPIAASASEAPKFGEYQTKGFLSDYSKISTTPDKNGAYGYKDESVDYSKYNKLLVDRIKIWFKDDSDYKGIDPDELKVLTDYFYKAIQKQLGDDYPMVDKAGPDVLRLRVAVTDLVPNKPEASLTTLVVPFLWVGEAGQGAATKEAGATHFTGEATLEVEALDSTSNTQLVAYVETEMGKKYKWDKGISEGVSSYMKAYSKWDYTKQAMDYWAKLLRTRLDAAHGKTEAKK